MRNDPSGDKGNGLPSEFDYSLEKYQKIDPSLIKYCQTAEISVKMTEPRGVAVGPEDAIYVVGDRSLLVFSWQGELMKTISLEGEPHCVAVGGADHAAAGRCTRHERPRRGFGYARFTCKSVDAWATRRISLRSPRPNRSFCGRRRQPHRLALRYEREALGPHRRER